MPYHRINTIFRFFKKYTKSYFNWVSQVGSFCGHEPVIDSPPKKNLYFLIELIEIYLPVPILCFSNERNEAPSPKYCSCKIPLYQGFFDFSKISIFGGLAPWFYVVFLWILRITKLESHNSKQMMVYEQITFLIKKHVFFHFCDLEQNRLFD